MQTQLKNRNLLHLIENTFDRKYIYANSSSYPNPTSNPNTNPNPKPENRVQHKVVIIK